MIDQSRDKSPLTQKFDIFSLKSIKSKYTDAGNYLCQAKPILNSKAFKSTYLLVASIL